MAVVVQLQVFTPEEAAGQGEPYQMAWHVAGQSPETLETAAVLLDRIALKLRQHADRNRGAEQDDETIRAGRRDRDQGDRQEDRSTGGQER